jgi:hypothetical protein
MMNSRLQSRNICPFVLLLFLTLLLGACAKKVSFTTSLSVPAAQGYVKIKKDNNVNYALSVNIKNLAEPKRLTPPMEVYVVWIETKRNGIRNLGQLKISSGLFSGNLEGTLESVSPFKPTRVFVTAEEKSAIERPGMQVVLKTSDF